MTKHPVVYFIFNRPEFTAKTFAVIRAQRPLQLFIVADGPRPSHSSDEELCKEVRAIVQQIDWQCEVHRNYADINFGLRRRISSGLNWVFTQVESAIILEDDCLAHPDFFRFCDELIEYYAHDTRIAVITGNNFQDGQKRGDASYYFSKYNHCWGWATWRRSWQDYKSNLSFWPEWSSSQDWHSLSPESIERKYWNRLMRRVHTQEIDSWAIIWSASVWLKGGLTATPNVNLVSNIGFGPAATHTKNANSILSEVPSYAIGSITHPSSVLQDKEADKYVFNHVFGGHLERFPFFLYSYPLRAIRKLFRMIKIKVSDA